MLEEASWSASVKAQVLVAQPDGLARLYGLTPDPWEADAHKHPEIRLSSALQSTDQTRVGHRRGQSAVERLGWRG